jgi:NAD(P)-dependent dehydrogenase (short-subunit alcohol dehydrogenase family)
VYSLFEKRLRDRGAVTEVDTGFDFDGWTEERFRDGQFVRVTGLVRLMDYGWISTMMEALPGMMLGAGVAGGSVVCTSSPAAFVGFAGGGNGAYAASKGGISALVRALALDYAPHGIRVNALVPGATDTAIMWAGYPEKEREAVRRDVEERAKGEIPLGRLARPEEPAHAVLWLLSDESSYVTGSHLVCDGGILAKSPNTF